MVQSSKERASGQTIDNTELFIHHRAMRWGQLRE
jgi:hypothetical protein